MRALIVVLHFLHLSKGIRFPDMPPLGDSPSGRILTGDPFVPQAPAPTPDLSSKNPWRLEIEEGSLLFGTPAQRVNVRIRLFNLEEGPERTFSLAVVESAQRPYKLIESISTSNLIVPGGEFRVLTLNLQIPETMASGHRNIIRVTATSSESTPVLRSAADRDQHRVRPSFVQMEFSFLTVYSFADTLGPRMASSSPPLESQCSNVQDCSNTFWKVIYHIKDDESGIRSIHTNPFIGINSGSLSYVHSPYILGDPLWEVRFVLSGSCCEKDLTLTALDGYGNEASVSLIPKGESSSNWGLSGAEIAIIVVSILLIVLFIGVITAIIIIRQRRAQSVNEMRRFPSPPSRA